MHDYRHYVGKVLDQLKLEKVLGVGGSGGDGGVDSVGLRKD